MKILALLGSPHRGNTFELTQRFEEHLHTFGPVDFEYIDLRKRHIKSCLGCFHCFMSGSDQCPLKDDIQSIVHSMASADGVVFVSPVYSLHVTALMKTFIDRLSYMMHRPRFFGKYAVAITAAGNPGSGIKETLKYMKGVTFAWGFEFAGGLGYVAPPQKTGLPKIATPKDRTEDIASKLYHSIRDRKPTKLTVNEHIWFRTMQTLHATIGERSPRDYEYFRQNGWLNPETLYFHDNIKVSRSKDYLARLIAGLTKRQLLKNLKEQRKQ